MEKGTKTDGLHCDRAWRKEGRMAGIEGAPLGLLMDDWRIDEDKKKISKPMTGFEPVIFG